MSSVMDVKVTEFVNVLSISINYWNKSTSVFFLFSPLVLLVLLYFNYNETINSEVNLDLLVLVVLPERK